MYLNRSLCLGERKHKEEVLQTNAHNHKQPSTLQNTGNEYNMIWSEASLQLAHSLNNLCRGKFVQ